MKPGVIGKHPRLDQLEDGDLKFHTDYRQVYATILEGTEEWRALDVPKGKTFDWDADSTYIREPPFFEGMSLDEPGPPAER